MGPVIGVKGRLHGCAASVCLRTASQTTRPIPELAALKPGGVDQGVTLL